MDSQDYSETIDLAATADIAHSGKRLDQVAAELFADYSRSRIKQWIDNGALQVNGEARKPKDRLVGGEQLTLQATVEPAGEWQPEPMALNIAYEDDHLLVINKPTNLVVHPAAGNYSGTLLNGLLHHCPSLENVPRAGIVHRLDKDTTGLMVVAKTLAAHHNLVRQLQARSVKREYEAVVQGTMTGGGTVEAAIGRHPRSRIKMAVVAHGGKEAITHYRLIHKFCDHTHIRLGLETGRTHQIRVHMAHIGHPLVGDATYAGRMKLPKGASTELVDMLRTGFKRQALHAASLALVHPHIGDIMEWDAPLPADFEHLLTVLANNEAD
ncbi:23S rRNA pseudouridine(1911/1915/1917) synthase RluD [Porticoccus sp. W117]|uniref:23S rRNA pseudouridine(1911/1915/1917) synthase RluD n=1 Tax=Porticoccus sp. W117 TaxID=3054777 RepID=UPI0025941D88|nr:23S rRNA pseudouridine(1911/1915/1917) synthase RluD [Porticoccus sp. W117]MDM3871250.1 23S rRNA pseudouridine(1911/1915/1917) synthase RluD [Porticoccus sp. W117]